MNKAWSLLILASWRATEIYLKSSLSILPEFQSPEFGTLWGHFHVQPASVKERVAFFFGFGVIYLFLVQWNDDFCHCRAFLGICKNGYIRSIPKYILKIAGLHRTSQYRKKQKTRVNTGFYTGYRTLSHCLKLAFGADGETWTRTTFATTPSR